MADIRQSRSELRREALRVARGLSEGDSALVAVLRELEQERGRATETVRAVVRALAVTLQARDGYTGEHADAVHDLSVMVGARLGLDGAQMAELAAVALLHDVGKIGIPDGVLHKPGPLDDATRLAYAEVLADEKTTTVVGFLRRACAFYRRHGMPVEQLMTDNGSAYRSAVHALACRALGIRHLRTRPYRPQTNGKAERFIRTMLGGWAYGAIYRTSDERTAALDGWIWTYNHRRRHSAIGHKPPIARLNERNNLLGTYS